MTLIQSISGIRGTVGGAPGENLSPVDVVQFVSAYAHWIRSNRPDRKARVVIGWDGRPTRDMYAQLSMQTLVGMGVDVYCLGLTTTPTVEVNVTRFEADGGIIITASHNPENWNALKFVNHKGEFLNQRDGEELLDILSQEKIEYSPVNDLGEIHRIEDGIDYHFQQILELDIVQASSIRDKGFRVVLDCINSSGALVVPYLEKHLSCQVVALHDEVEKSFAHNPEPLPSHVQDAMDAVRENSADVGFVVDPDVDRLAVIDEHGSFIGEENTIILLADHLLPRITKPITVSNLSSSRGLRDVTIRHGGSYYASAVGEVNVVAKMREKGAYFGGEGNGGVIFPSFHAGRDGILGMVLVLQAMAERNTTVSAMVDRLPVYHMVKSKLQLDGLGDKEKLFAAVIKAYEDQERNQEDGLKVDFEDGWVHLRTSNTEPIMRIYAEANTEERAERLVSEIKNVILGLEKQSKG